MAQPYIGEIRMFAGNYAPVNWALCDGSLLSIATYSPLYQLIGTTYGGDGATTFGLPDLRGRFPAHVDSSYVLGEYLGAETVALSSAQMPTHTHAPAAGPPATAVSPGAAVWGSSPDRPYSPAPSGSALAPGAVGSAGGNQPHENRSPYTGINFIIALQGVYPTP